MRILIIHNHYQDPGGEDTVAAQERQLLAGVVDDVALLTFQNRKGLRGAWQTLWSPWNVWAGRHVKRAIQQHRPDVIHIHNLHYAIGPIAIRIARRHSIPVVMTLHNYRLLCPSATLFYIGQVFTDSLDKPFPWRAVRLGVHSHSHFKTFWLAASVWLHKKIGTWDIVERYLVLTAFAKQLFVNSSLGVPCERFTVKPNFVADEAVPSQTRGVHFLFIGRLTEEKGIRVLLDAFAGAIHPLRIVGEGPLRNRVVEMADTHPNITYLGTLNRPEINEQLASCTALIFPSIWYEGMPITLIEAFASGTPVIASDLGAMRSMVHDGQNGWRFAAGDAADLRVKVEKWLMMDDAYRQRLGAHARQAYEQGYAAEQNRLLLLNIYHSTIGAVL